MFWQFANPNIRFIQKTFKKQALLAAARLGTHFMGTKVRKITISKITIKTTVYCTIVFETLGSKLVSMQFLTYLNSSHCHLLGTIQRLLASNAPIQRQPPSLLKLKQSPVRRCEFRQTRQFTFSARSVEKANIQQNSYQMRRFLSQNRFFFTFFFTFFHFFRPEVFLNLFYQNLKKTLHKTIMRHGEQAQEAFGGRFCTVYITISIF